MTASTQPQTTPLVACAGLARTFGTGDTAVAAVAAVTCTVWPGAHIALTGPSGSGKSTLLHLMAGLDTPSAGTVSWPAFAGHPRARPGLIGVVFQGPSLIPALDAAENVAVPLLLAGVPEQQASERAARALERLGIGELAHQLPQELSGGQAQRVAAARVLAATPRLILADEPTGQLDHAIAATVIDTLLQAATELGAALVVSTHDPLIAQRLPHQWSMHDGHLLDDLAAPPGDPR